MDKNQLIETELNLAIDEDVTALIKTITSWAGWTNLTAAEMENSIKFARNFFSKNYLKIFPADYPQLGTWHCTKNTGIPVADLITLCVQLRHLSACKGFSMLVQGFGNPTQFHDTLFEIEAAHYFFMRTNIKSLNFAPECKVNKSFKRPDFSVSGDTEEVICECKRLHIDAHKYANSFKQIAKEMIAAAEKIKIPESLRVNIDITNVIKGDRKKLAQAVSDVIESSICLGAVSKELNGLSISLSKRSQVPSLDSQLAFSQCWIGPIATPIFESMKIRITSSRYLKHLTSAIGKAIADAKTQIPNNKSGIIIIQSAHVECAQQAIDLRINLPEYSNILAIAVFSDGNISFSFRNSDEERLTALFGGF